MRRSHTSSFPRAGFTLVELMVALGIAALVAAILFAAYQVVVHTAERQGRRGRTATVGTAALDRISRDLACALTVPDVPSLGFVVDVPDGARSEKERLLALTTAVPPPDDPDLRWFTAEHVTYLVRQDALLRIARPLPVERGLPATTNVAATNVHDFEPRAWANGSWTNAWAAGEDSPSLPPAVQVRIVLGTRRGGSDQVYETEVYMPTGDTFTSRVTRVGTAEAR